MVLNDWSTLISPYLASRAGDAQGRVNAPKGCHQGRVVKGSKVSQAGVSHKHLCDVFRAVRITGVDLVKLFVQTLFVKGVPTLIHSDAIDRRPPTGDPCVASDRHGEREREREREIEDNPAVAPRRRGSAHLFYIYIIKPQRLFCR